MADQAELAFIKSFVSILAPHPLVYPDDYQQPPENTLKRLPVIPLDIPPPPKRELLTSSTSAAGSVTVHFKSLKPAHTFTLVVSPSDSISSIKTQLASTPSAPPADVQRLLFKGKALADNKLLQEYAIKDGDTLNLVLKPGFTWDPSAPTPAPTQNMSSSPSLKPEASPSLTPIVTMTSPEGTEITSKPKRGHQRIPSVVLSPSPSSTSPLDEKPADIPLTFDTSDIPTASEAAGPPRTSYHSTISEPHFWQKLFAFLKSEFITEEDAKDAFEDFLNSSKGSLTPHEIAKIRDTVGIIGMAGK